MDAINCILFFPSRVFEGEIPLYARARAPLSLCTEAINRVHT